MAHKLFLFNFLILSLFFATCNSLEPPPPEKTITLTLEDVSCTEAWIKLTTTNLHLPASISLKQNNLTISTINLVKLDTLLYIDSLLPNQTYSFQASIHTSEVKSNVLSITTLDTTSHNFTWQTFTFGEHSSSVLYDVAIINENNIWAVGEIYMNDSTGQAYNAVHWDGSEWKLRRIKTNACGGVVYPPIKAIFPFSANDILFAHIDGSISYYNGIEFINDCSLITQLNGSANKIWGISKDDFYVVSGNGFIAHYNGSRWTKIQSGTDLQFLDIYGATDSKTGEQQILAVCTRNYPLGKGIYSIEGNTATEISSYPIQWELWSVWFVPNRHYYVVGSGIYEKKILSDSLWKNGPLDITHYATTCIRGNGLNDVFVPGAFGELLHFNGMSWHSDYDITNIEGSYGRVALHGNLICCTGGLNNGQAIILLGRR